jgi:HAD superfamily hydrolase (TIGR01509 family)
MIKLIIFDLDGVLIDAKEIHYEALNKALVECFYDPISREDHINKFDGLNTNAKLDLLGVSPKRRKAVFDLKQKYTSDKIKDYWSPTNRIIYGAIQKLGKKYKICVASNSIRSTVKDALMATDLIGLVDFYLSNEDVKYPKPNAEIYLRCMIKEGVSPKETLIIEDSYNGRLGAESTGAYVMGVNSPKDVTYDGINNFIQSKTENKPMKWKDSKLNVLIPMAGRGSRFEAAGYTFPKPLIEVNGKPMIQVVVENLNIEANYIYLVQLEHYDKYNLKALLNLITPDCKIVIVDGVTEGAACTALLAKEYINNENPLLIANSDQFVEWDSSAFMYTMNGDNVDGGILTFKATHPKWSFVKIEDGWIKQVAEKNPISDNATVGIYYWKMGMEFVHCAEIMIERNIRTNNEFYIAPTYNISINESNGGRIKPFQIEKMWGIGTPEDLKYFLENYESK